MKRGGARGCGRESDVEVKINALFVATRTCVLTDNVARMGLSGGVNPAPNRCSIWQIGQAMASKLAERLIFHCSPGIFLTMT